MIKRHFTFQTLIFFVMLSISLKPVSVKPTHYLKWNIGFLRLRPWKEKTNVCTVHAPEKAAWENNVWVFTLKVKQPVYPCWKLCSRGMTFLSRERCMERDAMAESSQQSSKKSRFEKWVSWSDICIFFGLHFNIRRSCMVPLNADIFCTN